MAARLILASASPRRAALLRQAGFDPVIRPADVDEEAIAAGHSPSEAALLLAQAKAEVVARLFPDDLSLGADTVVELAGKNLGKPADAQAARQMLESLSGTTHQVITGVCLLWPVRHWRRQQKVVSTVQMRLLVPAEIQVYIAGGQWQGKAGGYGLQDADPFVVCTAGSASNIVGLPMEVTIQLLAEAGFASG